MNLYKCIRLCAYFSNSTGFFCCRMICTQTGGWYHKWHPFWRLCAYYGIDVYFGSFLFISVRSETRTPPRASPLYLRYPSHTTNAKERGENLNELLSTRHIYNTSNNDGHHSQSTTYEFRPIYTTHNTSHWERMRSRSRSRVCVHFYHHRFGLAAFCSISFTASRLIPVDQVSFHLTLLHACWCVSGRARLLAFIAYQMYKFRIYADSCVV